MLRRIGPKRLLLVLLAFGYAGLFVDAFVGHNASGGIDERRQYIPLFFSPLALVALLAAGALPLRERAVSWLTGLVGYLSAVIGVLGVAFHLAPILKDLSDDSLNYDTILGALVSGPPLLAPAAFVAI